MVEYLTPTLIKTPGLFNVPSLSGLLINQQGWHWAALVLLHLLLQPYTLFSLWTTVQS